MTVLRFLVRVDAAWNVVITADALADAGVTPEELVATVHPSLVGNTQGTGMGGMSSIHARAMRIGSQPVASGLPEKPCPGSDGITRWNASAALAPWAVGSVK